MNHSFDIDHACQYGIQEAILIQNLQFWILKNRANGRHEHDGKTWTYNSVAAFSELFPYMTADSVRRTLERLQTKKVLVKGNYNTSKYDRTMWFAFADEPAFLPPLVHLAKMPNEQNQGVTGAKPIWHKCQMGLAQMPNESGTDANSDTDIRTDVKKDRKEGECDPPSPSPIFSEQPEQPDSRSTKKDKQAEQPTPSSPTALEVLIEAVDVQRVGNGKKPLTKIDVKKIEQEAKAAGIDAAAALNWVLESPARNFFKSDYYTHSDAAETPPAAPTPPPQPLSKEEQAQREAARAAAALAAEEEEERLSGIWDYNKKLVGPKWAIDLVNDYLSGKSDIDNSAIKRFDACKALGIKEKALLAAHNDACAAALLHKSPRSSW